MKTKKRFNTFMLVVLILSVIIFVYYFAGFILGLVDIIPPSTKIIPVSYHIGRCFVSLGSLYVIDLIFSKYDIKAYFEKHTKGIR